MEGCGPVQATVTRRGQRADAFNAFVEPASAPALTAAPPAPPAHLLHQPHWAQHLPSQVLRDRPNLRVASEAFVRRVLIDSHAPGGPRACGVEVELPDGRRVEVRSSREVVLCAGAIMSPQLLMLSGVGDREELARHGLSCVSHVPAVGQHLQDHPACPLFAKLARPAPPVLANGALSGAVFHSSHINRAREVSEGRPRGPVT